MDGMVILYRCDISITPSSCDYPLSICSGVCGEAHWGIEFN
jgi:hypothetical protein